MDNIELTTGTRCEREEWKNIAREMMRNGRIGIERD